MEKKSTMSDVFKTVILACIIGMIAGRLSNAQNSGSVIEGYVFDNETQEALSGASVYLSETTLGDATDEEGRFMIEDVPAGRYQFVISYVGYEIFRVDVQIEENQEYFFERGLTPREVQLDSVVVTSKRDKEWERNFERFTTYFLGESGNGEETEILNPEILNFRTEKRILYAEAGEELQLMNRALGYKLMVKLTHFAWNYRSDTGGMLYLYRFEELDPADEDERLAWAENRQETYKYSPERFFKSLISGDNREDYKISRGTIKPLAESAAEPYKRSLGGKHVHGFRVDIRRPNKLLKVLIDDPDIYEDEEVGYIGYNETKEQIVEVIYIDNNGKLLNPLDFTLNGIWFDYRIADELPLNYRPDQE